MPHGLRNVPETFQGTMNVILSTVKWQSALVYLGDIVVFLRTPEKHTDHLSLVLSFLHNAGVTLELEKCKFFIDINDYLGHVNSSQKLEIASHTRDAICELQPSTSLRRPRSSIGL